MNTNQNYEQNSADEIDLRDLFLTFWRQKVLIISITLIVAILTGLFSVFVLSPVYNSKLNIVISMPETYKTRFGEYTLPITTNQQYMKLITSNNVVLNTMKDLEYSSGEVTLEDLKDRITIGSIITTEGIEQNSFDVTVSADNPQEAQKFAEALYENYVEFLDVMTKERAVTYYYDKYSTDIKSLKISLESDKEILKKNEELLAETSQTINQKEAMQEIQSQNNESDFVVLENIINPNYTKIENDIILNKQLIYTDENFISVYTDYLEELDIEKQAIAKYYETGNTEKLESNIIGIVNTSVYLPSPPAAPTRKTSPSNAKNVVIGGFLGGMIGVLSALIKNYWFKKA
jgi:capsular polysaccharide biosynthesis protein